MEENAFLLWSVIALTILLVWTFARIKRLKKEKCEYMLNDAETGIGNLSYFRQQFANITDAVSEDMQYIAYIVLDISYLRSYHGNTSFEEALKYTVSVLPGHIKEGEIMARITENGFAIVIKSDDEESAQRRFEEIMIHLNNFEGAKARESKLVFHGAIYRLGNNDKNCELLLFNLRKNCYGIYGTNRQIIQCDVHSMNEVQEEKKLFENIVNGFENKEFKMYLQFIVDNKTKRIASAEALSRWDKPSEGILAPGRYIEALESSGLISRLDFYMFELACSQLEKWNNTKYKDISISCNFTRITLSETEFIERLRTISQRYNFDKTKLAIEITEDAMEKNIETATKNVCKCKELGFRIYLDDMGSGYTTLANLCDYPIDVVKIDREIMMNIESPRNRNLFEGIITLAHSMGIKTVAEGVETEEHNKVVSSSYCDYVQGWYYSKPIPQEEWESFIDGFSG